MLDFHSFAKILQDVHSENTYTAFFFINLKDSFFSAGDDDNNFYVEAVGLNPTLHTVWADVRVKKVVDFEQTGNTIALTIT